MATCQPVLLFFRDHADMLGADAREAEALAAGVVRSLLAALLQVMPLRCAATAPTNSQLYATLLRQFGVVLQSGAGLFISLEDVAVLLQLVPPGAAVGRDHLLELAALQPLAVLRTGADKVVLPAWGPAELTRVVAEALPRWGSTGLRDVLLRWCAEQCHSYRHLSAAWVPSIAAGALVHVQTGLDAPSLDHLTALLWSLTPMALQAETPHAVVQLALALRAARGQPVAAAEASTWSVAYDLLRQLSFPESRKRKAQIDDDKKQPKKKKKKSKKEENEDYES